VEPNSDADDLPPPRVPFDPKFPNVIVQQPANSPIRLADHPDYEAAKAGDSEAAARVVVDSIDERAVEKVRQLIGERKPLIVPVHAEEAAGRNRLPVAYARELADRLGLEGKLDIVQANRPHRTGADAASRLVNRAEFAGPVNAGREYFLVDDAVTQGGTLADLRSYIESQGGKVIGSSTLMGAPLSHILAPTRKTIAALREKLPGLEPWWRETFGHGFEALTESELHALHRFNSTDSVRDRLATEGSETGLGRGRPRPSSG